MANILSGYEQIRLHNAIIWYMYPRPLAILVFAGALAIILDPFTAIGWGLVAWILFALLRRIIRDPYDREMWWMGCGPLVSFAVTNPLKWLLILGLAGIATLRGAPIGETIVVVGFVMIVDVFVTRAEMKKLATGLIKESDLPVYDGYQNVVQRITLEMQKQNLHLGEFSREQAIQAAEDFLEEDPEDWDLLFWLGDKYNDMGRYADALDMTKRCVHIRPNDVKSAYALASNYNILTRANFLKFQNDPRFIAMQRHLAEYDETFDPQLSADELEKIGMSTEDAARHAIFWFRYAYELDDGSATDMGITGEQIRKDLETLYTAFPHLASEQE